MSADRDDRNLPEGEEPQATEPQKGKTGEPGSYKVGKGKPPRESQWKPGKSGNPAGRKTGSKNRPKPGMSAEAFWRTISEHAAAIIPLNTAQGQDLFTRLDAIMTATFATAMKGRVPAQRLYYDMTSRAAAEVRQLVEAEVEAAWKYKEAWTRELARRRTLNLKLADPPIHPDQIEIDLVNGRVRIHGPVTEQEKAVWSRMEWMRETLERERAELEARRDDPHCPDLDVVDEEIERTATVLRIVEAAFDHNPVALDLLAGLTIPDEEEG